MPLVCVRVHFELIRVLYYQLKNFIEQSKNKMYYCPTCDKNIAVNSSNDVRYHLNQHKKFGQLRFPIQCSQGQCKSSFASISNLMKHLGRHQPPIIFENAEEMEYLDEDEENDIIENPENDVTIESDHEENDLPTAPQPQCVEELFKKFEDDMKNQLFEIILSFRSKGNVTLLTTLQIIEEISGFISSLIDKMLQAMRNQFLVTTDVGQIPGIVEQFSKCLESVKKIPASFNSEYKIRQHYESHPLFVSPESLVISQRYKFIFIFLFYVE